MNFKTSRSINGNARRAALASSSAAALLLIGMASAAAQTAPSEGIEQVVVSSSRIQSAGFDAPTPTTIIDSDFIKNSAQPNLIDTLVQLPSIAGSLTTAIGSGGSGSNGKGVSALNIRALGVIRTLVTMDSQRVVAADFTGIADVSEFPQLLVKRVDVVTGGASASFGSDAIAGVVNFVTEKKFEGIKGDLSGGISTYGDNQTTQFRLAAGTSFLGGKAHIEGSAEYTYNQGVPGGTYGLGNGPNGRTWYNAPGSLSYTAPTATVASNTPAGQPQINFQTNTQLTTLSRYGLITSGPLAGYAFNANGAASPFLYGAGVTGVQLAPGVQNANCLSSLCVGGDLSGNYQNMVNLAAASTRGDTYTRLSYDIGQESEIYGTATLSQVWTQTKASGAQRETGLTIGCGAGTAALPANAFLPAAINTACTTAKATSFGYGVDVNGLTPNTTVSTTRDLRRFVLGSDGAFDIFGQRWTYDAYYEHGESDVSIHDHGIILKSRFTAALAAVAGPNGSIICNDATARASGCVPLNLFGNVQQSQAALDYITPPQGEFQSTALGQDVASVVVNGQPFSTWAGPVDLATGVEYRQEKFSAYADPYGAGVSAASPYSALYPADATLSTTGANWFVGNFNNGGGNYHVSEGFVELGVPLLDDKELGKVDVNLAGRATGYSTSGYVQTWKTGLTWQTPLDGLKLRALQSRDIRAPNLSELFAPAVSSKGSNLTNPFNGNAILSNATTTLIGNAALKPEKSQTTEVGLVYQPSWFPGFSSSLDYWRVAIKGQIGSLGAQDEINACFNSGGTSPICAALSLNGASQTILLQSFNLASTVTDGFDLESSYQFDLSQWDVPGNFSLRTLVNHTTKFISNTGVAGVPVTETAGVNTSSTSPTPTGSVPLWRTYTTETWSNDKMSFNLTERWFSDGVFNKSYITCAAGTCPVTTVANPTTNFNHMIGAFYLDVGASYNVSDAVQVYGKIDNITNPVPATPNTGVDNPSLYDVVGRMFRIGVRFSN